MIIQSVPLILKQQNQPNRECLYAWYPEAVPDSVTTTTMPPRDIYTHKGIDQDLIRQNPQTNGLLNNCNNNDAMQRYQQSIAPSHRIYHSAGTIDEALRTPWALNYEVQRRPATPNPPSHSNDMPIREETSRRLKSAPLIRSLPPTSILTIPEPCFITPVIPVTTTEIPQSSLSITKPRIRASSAKARLNTTATFEDKQRNDDRRQERREIKSAQRIRQKDEMKLFNEDNQKDSTQTYADILQQQEQPLFVPPTPPPVYVYQKSSSWCSHEPPIRTTAEINPTPLNPHYIHRPGIISAKNIDKKPVVQDTSESKKTNKYRRRPHHHRHHHHHHHQEKRNEPLLALTPVVSQSTKLPAQLDGIKLIYDPKLTLDDPSSNLTKYYIEGRLYLIKDQRYNVLENIDPTTIETYNQNLTLPQRPKYYQTIPVEKLQIPKPPSDVHYNASETYFYNTLPKRVHRYVIDPNFISENLNVNKISLSNRPSTSNGINRQAATSATIYA